MVKFIFDLDYTLYGIRDNINTSNNMDLYYDSFKPKLFLKSLLKQITKLSGKNINTNDFILFTNGNEEHATLVLTKLDLLDLFGPNKIVARNTFEDTHGELLKPNPLMYNLMIDKCKIKKDETVYFFEDTGENLEMAKNFGWQTILINPNRNNYNKFNYSFSHIEEALLFFIVKKNFDNKF